MKLLGHVIPPAGYPAFVAPVFEQDGHPVVQIVTENQETSGFEPVAPELVVTVSDSNLHELNLERQCFGFAISEKSEIYGDQETIRAALVALLEKLDNHPLVALQVARFIGDSISTHHYRRIFAEKLAKEYPQLARNRLPHVGEEIAANLHQHNTQEEAIKASIALTQSTSRFRRGRTARSAFAQALRQIEFVAGVCTRSPINLWFNVSLSSLQSSNICSSRPLAFASCTKQCGTCRRIVCFETSPTRKAAALKSFGTLFHQTGFFYTPATALALLSQLQRLNNNLESLLSSRESIIVGTRLLGHLDTDRRSALQMCREAHLNWQHTCGVLDALWGTPQIDESVKVLLDEKRLAEVQLSDKHEFAANFREARNELSSRVEIKHDYQLHSVIADAWNVAYCKQQQSTYFYLRDTAHTLGIPAKEAWPYIVIGTIVDSAHKRHGESWNQGTDGAPSLELKISQETNHMLGFLEARFDALEKRDSNSDSFAPHVNLVEWAHQYAAQEEISPAEKLTQTVERAQAGEEFVDRIRSRVQVLKRAGGALSKDVVDVKFLESLNICKVAPEPIVAVVSLFRPE